MKNLETGNKPCPLTIERIKGDNVTSEKESVRLQKSAAEMAYFSRYLGLIIGDFIPKEDEHFAVYRILQKLVGIVKAPKFLESDVFIL